MIARRSQGRPPHDGCLGAIEVEAPRRNGRSQCIGTGKDAQNIAPVGVGHELRKPVAELLDENASNVEQFQRAMLPAIWAMARDVPAPTPMPETPPPFEQARRMFFEGPGIDRGTTILALRGREIVGMSVTAVKENGTAYTNFTGVARAERGKGVALAMKLRALRALKERGIKRFGRTNDEQNAAMRGINRKLGYVPDPPTVMYEKKVTS